MSNNLWLIEGRILSYWFSPLALVMRMVSVVRRRARGSAGEPRLVGDAGVAGVHRTAGGLNHSRLRPGSSEGSFHSSERRQSFTAGGRRRWALHHAVRSSLHRRQVARLGDRRAIRWDRELGRRRGVGPSSSCRSLHRRLA